MNILDASMTPFGNPDGALAQIEDITRGFVSLSGQGFPISLATESARTRAIAGPKGSGKSVYLKRMRDSLKTNPSIYIEGEHDYLAKPEVGFKKTAEVVTFCTYFDVRERTVKWQEFWKAAIYCTVLSHIYNFDFLKDKLSNTLCNAVQKLISDKDVFLLSGDFEFSIGDFASAILTKKARKDAMHNFLNNEKLLVLRKTVEKSLYNMPPLWFFVDCIDEEYKSAPNSWLACQVGLFYAVSELAREPVFSNKLHVVICIRDIVLMKVYMSEHAPKYKDVTHIKILSWDYRIIRHFFEEKIKQLHDEFFIERDFEEKTIGNWLGILKIQNIERGFEEDILDYLIRHTTLLPRDIVILGNKLASITFQLKQTGQLDPVFAAQKIRKAVDDVAREIGENLIVLCANSIAEYSADSGFTPDKEHFTSDSSYVHFRSEEYKLLVSVISKFKTNRFSWDKATEVIEYAKSIFNGYPEDARNNILDILWRHGAIGYVATKDGKKYEVFASIADYSNTRLTFPAGRNEYIIRPCIVDAIGNGVIKSVGDIVYGGNR